MHSEIYAATTTGPVRDGNEDAFFVNGICPKQLNRACFEVDTWDKSNIQLYAVFDGMGGENAGELASSEAARLLRERFNAIKKEAGNSLDAGVAAVNEYVREANDSIFRLSSSLPGNHGMGTTFVGLLISGRDAATVNAGDSRAYLFRDNALQLLTHDHSESERLLRLGLITKEQSYTHKGRNMLNRYFGVPPEEGAMEGEVSSIGKLMKGDIVLLCSDGLTNMVDDEAIRATLKKVGGSPEAMWRLLHKAVDNGGKDNITLILVSIK